MEKNGKETIVPVREDNQIGDKGDSADVDCLDAYQPSDSPELTTGDLCAIEYKGTGYPAIQIEMTINVRPIYTIVASEELGDKLAEDIDKGDKEAMHLDSQIICYMPAEDLTNEDKVVENLNNMLK